MAARKSKSSLEKKLEKLQKRDGGTIKIESIAAVVDEIVSSATAAILAKDNSLLNELGLLREYIDEAKSEIANLRPDEVKTLHLPKASGELDAIVEATEIATNEIMDATEIIGQIGDAVGGEQGDKIADATMRIFQACGFQDITGQRITKIIGALKHIEDKIDDLARAFGDGSATKAKKSAKKSVAKKSPKKSAKKSAKKSTKKSTKKKTDKNSVKSDADLLDGPQLPGGAIQQDEVDALLASFD